MDAELEKRIIPHMSVESLDSMGTDLDVVNAARVSFNKHSTHMDQQDEKLIQYLAKNGHWTPFAHCFMKFRIEMPIFVARQLVRHTVGVAINEVSRRYIDTPPRYYKVDAWRGKASNKKQGSTGPLDDQIGPELISYSTIAACDIAYSDLLTKGVCPEQARMVLPLCTMTEWIYSGSLYAFSRITNLRVHPHAQKEVEDLVKVISTFAVQLFPVSWNALVMNSGPART